MSDDRDDPRQVLAFLNTLGVIGITAPQLKAFMKDLKLHRKIREKEQQQWKERTITKIISKQQAQRHCKTSICSSETDENSTTESDKLNSLEENHEPRIGVRIQIQKPIPSCQDLKNRILRERNNNADLDIIEVHPSTKSEARECRKGTDTCVSHRSKSRVESIDDISDATKCTQRKSKSTSNNGSEIVENKSQHRPKSYIRPWHLQPPVHNQQRTKLQWSKKPANDPVALYAKYTAFWKKLSLPGEETHANLRWAIRERMIGSDPTPRPVVPLNRKTSTTSSANKR